MARTEKPVVKIKGGVDRRWQKWFHWRDQEEKDFKDSQLVRWEIGRLVPLTEEPLQVFGGRVGGVNRCGGGEIKRGKLAI